MEKGDRDVWISFWNGGWLFYALLAEAGYDWYITPLLIDPAIKRINVFHPCVAIIFLFLSDNNLICWYYKLVLAKKIVSHVKLIIVININVDFSFVMRDMLDLLFQETRFVITCRTCDLIAADISSILVTLARAKKHRVHSMMIQHQISRSRRKK